MLLFQLISEQSKQTLTSMKENEASYLPPEQKVSG